MPTWKRRPAAATLGRYGSASAEQPLWDRLRKWRSAWVGRASELPNGSGGGLPNGLETALGGALIEAIGSGQAWFAEPEKLARLASFCVSRGGCQRVQQIIEVSPRTPMINLFGSAAGGYSATVNQYRL